MIESDQNHAKEDAAIKQLASTSGLFSFTTLLVLIANPLHHC